MTLLQGFIDVDPDPFWMSGITSILTGLITWVASKRKYSADVKAQEITNTEHLIKVYKQAFDDFRAENEKHTAEMEQLIADQGKHIESLEKRIAEILKELERCKKRFTQ